MKTGTPKVDSPLIAVKNIMSHKSFGPPVFGGRAKDIETISPVAHI